MIAFWISTIRAGDPSPSAPPQTMPSLAQVQAAATEHFGHLPGWRQSDLITRKEVDPLLDQLEKLGWKNIKRKELTDLLVKADESWARSLQTQDGLAFMRKVSSESLIFDRLERLSKMPGGEALVRDMVRLPDGHRYARSERTPGAPQMVEFLPKGPSGKAPKPADYDKPTGRIYTASALMTQLQKMHAKDAVTAKVSESAAPSPTPRFRRVD